VAVSGIVSLDEQIASMAQAYPMLRVVEREKNAAVWRGPLRPLFMPFDVQIAYQIPLIIEVIDPRRQQPRVTVLRPRLRYRRRGDKTELPHVYWDGADPILCLFDPEGSEWTPLDRLSETTVKWAIDWLACYEGWRATGEWAGGGRHPLPSEKAARS
jgi:hypothetical protein